MALGNLNSVSESDKKDGSPNVAGQSNLSLLLQRESKTPSPPELQASTSPPSLADAVDKLGKPQNQNNNDANDKHSESDSDLESIENNKDELQPLLNYQLGIVHNYGISDDVISIEEDHHPWAEKSWLEWLPCVGDNHYLLPSYDGEELSQPRVQITAETVFREVILNPLSYIPAVILGLLLNLLDAISYGMEIHMRARNNKNG